MVWVLCVKTKRLRGFVTRPSAAVFLAYLQRRREHKWKQKKKKKNGSFWFCLSLCLCLFFSGFRQKCCFTSASVSQSKHKQDDRRQAFISESVTVAREASIKITLPYANPFLMFRVHYDYDWKAL